MKTLVKFQPHAMSASQLKEVKGGDDCHNSYSAGEVDFLMRANGWSRSTAQSALYYACRYAAH